MNSKQRKQVIKRGRSKQAYNFVIDQFLKWRSTSGHVDTQSAFKEWIATKRDFYVDALMFDDDDAYPHYSLDTLGITKVVEEEVERRFETKFLD